MIMRVMVRFRWLSYLGLLFLIYLAAAMLHDGMVELAWFPPLFGTSA
jgi:predicted tellurium resistance membrane protein TerC